jgi:hypothetical protein
VNEGGIEIAGMQGQVALVRRYPGVGRPIRHRLATPGVKVAARYSRDRTARPGSYDARSHRGRQHNIGSNDDERVIRDVLDQHGRFDFLVDSGANTIDKMVRR